MGRENIFKTTIGNESLHQDSNDNSIRIVNFAKSQNQVVKSTMFPHRNTFKYKWSYAGGKTHNQIYHILIDRRWRPSILDVRSARGTDCDTDHYPVVAKAREKLEVSKQAAQNVDGESFNLRKLNEEEDRKQNQIEISNRFAALENVSDSEDIKRAWENIKDNIKASATCKEGLGLYELKHYKLWFHK